MGGGRLRAVLANMSDEILDAIFTECDVLHYSDWEGILVVEIEQ